MTLDLDDIQGIVARGYAGLRAACYVLVGLDRYAHPAGWLSGLADDVTRASARPGDQAANVAFTPSGLRSLGLPEHALRMFSPEFADGMTTSHRSRLLGDVDDLAPEGWAWGGPATPPVAAVLLLYAVDASALDALHQLHTRRLREAGGFEILRLDTTDLDGVEPFGFRDGISQPLVEGLARAGEAATPVRAGEFVLGYPNEYGQLTSRPLLSTADDPTGLLPLDPGGSRRRDLGRNGTYLVFRQLAQDVRGFWRFVDQATASAGGASDQRARLRLAAKMVGRWPSGAPLVLAGEVDDPSLAEANDFGYFSEDPHGLRCPIAAHVRRANPRDSLDPDPGSARSVAINNRHRLLRRGREYGPSITIEQALERAGPADHEDGAGIHFLCVNANISRQFEFVQHTWVNNPSFAGLYREPDPLVSPLTGQELRIPGSPVRTRLTGLPRFVSVRGGAYFFLPGVGALRYLSTRAGIVEP